MALREIGEDGSTDDVLHLPHRREFDATWLLIPAAQRAAIEAEINRRLDDLISSPDPNWGSITNTSIEGGKRNPATGVREIGVERCSSPSTRFVRHGRGTCRHVLRQRLEKGHHRAPRTLEWNSFRPHLPQKGISLGGKTYFLQTT